MKELIKLDFFIQKKYIKELGITSLFLILLFTLMGGIEEGIYSLGIFLVFYLVIIPMELEKRNKFNLCLNSIPLKKIDYILTKYITSILYLVLVNSLTLLSYGTISLILGNDIKISFSLIYFFISFELIYIAVFMPLYIFMNYKYYKVINIITTSTSIIFGQVLVKVLKDRIELNNMYPTLVILGISLIFLSFFTTVFFYKRSEVK